MPSEAQRLDHIGLIVDDEGDVERWHAFLLAHGVTIAQGPKKHRDGARSLYCYDPAGTLVQLIYHPPLSKGPALP
jgi:catechol 2,3-dioxygenase-like lactoylglutathione lyase family enzyme